jgi:DNA-directed RNA polymerase specialized sigma24 family protein
MSYPESSAELASRDRGAFVTTRWTVVLKAGEGGDVGGDEAMAQLCRMYWYPLYGYVRRSGFSQHDAEDLTQEFFARLLAKNYIGDVDREKGKFRSFLLACLKHFLSNERKHARRLKRGGGQAFVPLDDDSVETRYLAEAAIDLTPGKLFDRCWALTVLTRVLEALRREHLEAGKGASFECLKPFLTADETQPAQARLATELGMTPAALKMAVSRLRRRYRELLRATIAETVVNPADVEEEWRHLIEALG